MDSRKQILGMQSRAAGALFEKRIDTMLEEYAEKGIACIEKTPEPMRPVRSQGAGKFTAVFTKKAQPDYQGTLSGGKSIVFEAKYTSAEKIEQSRVTDEQARKLNEHEMLGAECFVIVGFASQCMYKIPWKCWKNMKNMFGHKYATEKQLKEFRVKNILEVTT